MNVKMDGIIIPEEEDNYCNRCDGEGIILVCWDDICHGLGYCIHGDGEVICPECEGEGIIYQK